MMKLFYKKQWWLLSWWVVVLAACGTGGETAVSEPTHPLTTATEAAAAPAAVTMTPSAVSLAPTEPAVDEATPSPRRPTITPLPPTPDQPLDALRFSLEATVWASLPPTPTPDASGYTPGGFESLRLLPLPISEALWVVHSVGFRVFDPPLEHFAALYQYGAGEWQLLDQLSMNLPDFLFEHSVTPVDLRDGRIWLEVESGAGAHGGCYELLRYDGMRLEAILSHCHSSPGAASGVQDINADNVPDLMLNHTVDYVFCYACGVRLPVYQLLRFDGESWQDVELQMLPDTAPAELRSAHNEAVALAQAGLWQEAAAMINQVESQEPVVTWNRIFINLHADTLREMVETGPYPLLAHLFYGDYEAVLEMMRRYAPAELFDLTANPLIVGTVADGWQDVLGEWVATKAADVVRNRPERAAAYFLRAWGSYLVDPANPQVVTDLETAVELAPDEALFRNSLAYWQDR